MNYIKLIPRPLRQAAYDKFLDELQRLSAVVDVPTLLEHVKAAVRRALAL